jgi:phospholipid/cholesterol/gamma-HCH transport system substrate-binding protein
MELRYRREAAVGFFLIVATVVFVLGMMWLRGKSLRSGELVRIVFTDVSGLKIGDPVRTSGVTVGQVQDIRLVSPGKVVVNLELAAVKAPRGDARAMVRALDFFGARYVDYDPGTAAEPLRTTDPIPGQREADLTELAQSVAGPGRQALNNAAQLLGPQTAVELRGVLTDARAAIAQLGNATETGSREAGQTLLKLRELLQRLDLLLGGGAAAQTLENVRDASRNLAQVTATLQKTSTTLDSILGRINTGRGSLGRLVNDTTLVTDLHEASTALTTLLNDVRVNPKRYINVRIF